MNYLMGRMPKKALILGIGLLFVLLNIQPIFGTNPSSILKAEFSSKIKEDTGMPMEVTENSEENCYGILVPLIHGENLPYTSIQQSISNMINDLLRLNVSVYWAANNFTTLSIKTGESVSSDFYFERGTFIIPFTGNMTIDVLIASIAHDYESKSEIEEYYPVEMYYLMEPLTLDMYPLNYPKVAYHFGGAVHYLLLLCYLDTLQAGGFLDHQMMLDGEIADCLNNEDFDLFIWPGQNLLVGNIPAIKTALHLKASKAIREFVEKGGGYIGSCYGAFSASSGEVIPFNILQHYFKKLPATLCLSLTSGIGFPGAYSGIITVNISDMDHPVTFGLEKIQKTMRSMGPVFIWTGCTTKTLAKLEDVSVSWIDSNYKNLPPWLIDRWIQFELGKPIWITSEFGNGRVVVFGDHPELPEPYRLDRLIHNAAFYTTADEKRTLRLDKHRSLLEIELVSVVTDNLQLKNHSLVFNNIWNETEYLYNICGKIDNIQKEILNQAWELTNEGKIDTETYGLIHTEYRDSYQRWLKTFSYALQKLEQVFLQALEVKDISSLVNDWKNDTISSLEIFNEICENALENNNKLVEKLENEYCLSYDKSSLTNLLKKRDENFRRGYQHVIQLPATTVKLYRKLWYIHEADEGLSSLKNSKTPSQFTNVSPNIDSTVCSDFSHYGARTIYVDDDVINGGNGSRQHPFQHLQDAIEAANDGDTIMVNDGVYYELITVYKSVNLVGNDMNTTIIDGGKKPRHIVTVYAPNVEINGFTIRNSSIVGCSCGIILQSNGNVVRGNILKNNRAGLGLRPQSKNNIITNNIVINNSLLGIILDETDSINNTISGNIIADNCCHGLFLANADNVIKDNIFINDGITIASSKKPLVVKITNNTVDGKPVYCYKNKDKFAVEEDAGQIILSNCSKVLIDNLTLSGRDTGIYVLNSDEVKISNCKISENQVGINLQYSENVNIFDNLIENNSWSAIWISHSENNNVSKNKIGRNDEGILLSSASENSIKNNDFVNNGVGISIWSSSKGNKLFSNIFMGNHENAYDKCWNKWENNYWDDWNGLDNPKMRWRPYNIPGRILLNFDWHPANTISIDSLGYLVHQ